MNCPYCGRLMKLGIIHGDRYKLKWIAKENDKGIFLAPFIKGIPLSTTSSSVESYLCNDCDKIIINISK